ncbi:MAG: PSD1 and planctomycete cytochrome C domain-containing protein, partial [Pirellulales bacterium]
MRPIAPNLIVRCRLAMALMAACVASTLAPAKAADEPAAAISDEDARFFETRIRPLLATHCWKCHGEKKQEYGLRLDSRAAVLKGSDDGQVVIPGMAAKSKLVEAIRYAGDIKMPPEPDIKLADHQIEAVAAWIDRGMPWPTQPASETSLTGDALLAHARANHWAFQPVRHAPAATVKNEAWCAGPIDRYTLAALEAKGLAPSPPADRRTLIRRATFDLVGLPPTFDEVEDFVHEKSPDAYERLIDRLLSSPAFGERWGRHWLDVARYADTRGYAFGRERRFPYAYTYRDYVIGALNADLPYDRFVTEQLAADRLELGDDKRSLAALGFLTVGRRFDNQPDDMDDRIDTVTRGLLGLTAACARCHDHKYDPIPTEDYYSLYGVFASTVEPPEQPVIGKPAAVAAFAEFQKKLTEFKGELDAFVAKEQPALIDALRRKTPEYFVHLATNPQEQQADGRAMLLFGPDDLRPKVIDRWRRYIKRRAKPDHPEFGPWARLLKLPDELFAEQSTAVLAAVEADPAINPLVKKALASTPPKTKADVARVYGQLLCEVYDQRDAKDPPPGAVALRKILLEKETPTDVQRDELLELLDRKHVEQLEKLHKQLEHHQAHSQNAPPRAMMVVDAPKPFDPYVFVRGNQFRHGKPVPRQFLQVVAGPERKPFAQGSGRLELARAIASPQNPLTARVIANRLWMHHFGRPLVESPSDFGLRTSPPTHPELLDYLASELVVHNWSLKNLHRRMMLSATYRQASGHRPECAAADPENRLVWRANRRRLEFEALRDAVLAVAGRLESRIGGPPFDLMAQPAIGRRTVYALVDRQDLPNVLRVFDFASPDQSAAQRPQTTVPQQALFLLNGALVAEQ